MKKVLFICFNILVYIVLIGIVSNWIFNYNDKTNHIIHTAMFILIGIFYVAGGFIWEKKYKNILFLICGLYLIIMNFVEDFFMKDIIVIACALIPLLIARFSPPESDEEEELVKH